MWDSGKKLTLSDSDKRIFLQILKAQPFGNEELVSKQYSRLFVVRIYRKEVLKVKQYNSSLWINYGVHWAILQTPGFSTSLFTLRYFAQFEGGNILTSMSRFSWEVFSKISILWQRLWRALSLISFEIGRFHYYVCSLYILSKAILCFFFND